MNNQYLPSTRDGKIIHVSLGKNNRGENCLFATEGTLKYTIAGDEFTYAPFDGDRSQRVSFGRNTRKNRDHAVAVLLSDLLDADMVPKGTAIKTFHKVY